MFLFSSLEWIENNTFVFYKNHKSQEVSRTSVVQEAVLINDLFAWQFMAKQKDHFPHKRSRDISAFIQHQVGHGPVNASTN